MLKSKTYLALCAVAINLFSFSQSNTPCGGSGAPNIAVNTSCSFTAGTTVGSTQQTNGANFGTPSCGSMGPDVWYSFVAPASGSVTITTQAGTITDGVMALYSSDCSGTYTQIDCDDDSNGLMPEISAGGLTPGQTYYIRFWRYGGGTGTFSICVYSPVVGPCTADMSINTTTYSQSGLTTCGFGDDYDSGDACGSSYMNGDDIVIAYTPTTTECVSLSLSNTGTWVGMFITDDCPDAVGVTCLASNTNSSGNPSISGFNVTAGTTYYLTISTFPAPQCTAFDLNIVACPPPGVCGDITVNTTYYSQSGLTTCGFGDDYDSGDACGSSYMNGDDIVIAYTPTTTECVQIALSGTDTWVGVFLTDGCPDDVGVNCLANATNSAGNPVLSGYTVTAGTTYYITVSTFPSPQCTPFNINITACPPPPPNDECANATGLPVTPIGNACAPTAGYVTDATASPQANGCFGTADDDVWYSFVATTTDVQIDLSSIVGSTTDMYFSVYGGTCGAPGAALLCSDPNSGQVSGLTVGNTYFIRVYTYTSTGGQSVNFNICVSEIGPCGIASATEDYCPYAATLTQGAGSWGSTTYDYYTADTPGNSGSIFCGSVENNSWYEFTAQSTTEVFNFSSVGNCTTGWGVQAQVFDVTYDASGCCSSFTSMSNCWNPGVPTSGTVTATGLTIGENYVLMVDGWGGDNCEFIVSGWTASGILLPVELVDLSAAAINTKNVIKWRTITEKDNDFFRIQRSYDGINFETIGQVAGAGNSQNTLDYAFDDLNVRTGIVYYKIIQVDFDGETFESKTISLDRSSMHSGIVSTYPNPANEEVFVEIQNKDLNGVLSLELRSSTGQVIYETGVENMKGKIIKSIPLTGVAKGMYMLVLKDENGTIQIEKVIKN